MLQCCVAAVTTAAAQGTGWLDRPLQNWNGPGAAVPRATGTIAGTDAARCKLEPLKSAAGRAVAEAGWLPQPHLDRELIRDDVEVVAGVSGLDTMCAPTGFNLFVFVGGRYAGTLSPLPMSPATDASAGAVRFADGGITTEFARYKPGDSTCCPTSRMAVRYRIDRGERPVVVPLDARTTRSY